MPPRNKWTQKELEDALRNINSNKMGIQTASKTFGIPRRTLRNYVAKGSIVKGK